MISYNKFNKSPNHDNSIQHSSCSSYYSEFKLQTLTAKSVSVFQCYSVATATPHEQVDFSVTADSNHRVVSSVTKY